MMVRLYGVCILSLVSLLVPVTALALSDSDVRRMQEDCEEKRQAALAPIRERKTQACIEQQLRTKGHCERYYTTYGNVTPGPTGAPQQGYFYDLPECQAWLEARDALRVSRSRTR
jgi:hypothetical protein